MLKNEKQSITVKPLAVQNVKKTKDSRAGMSVCLGADRDDNKCKTHTKNSLRTKTNYARISFEGRRDRIITK